jgi:hypothetical protein
VTAPGAAIEFKCRHCKALTVIGKAA